MLMQSRALGSMDAEVLTCIQNSLHEDCQYGVQRLAAQHLCQAGWVGGPSLLPPLQHLLCRCLVNASLDANASGRQRGGKIRRYTLTSW